MAMPFTNQELKCAWRELSRVATPANNNDRRENPHRLLLFYAVECGLKAVLLKRKSQNLFEKKDIEHSGHNLKRILKDLHVGSELHPPENFELKSVNPGTSPRTGEFSDLHQAWRYGGKCQKPTDLECEQRLEKVLSWIQGELK